MNIALASFHENGFLRVQFVFCSFPPVCGTNVKHKTCRVEVQNIEKMKMKNVNITTQPTWTLI